MTDAPMILPFDHWPRGHQELWARGLDPDNLDDDDDPPPATKLSVATVRNARKGWGRFLAIVGVIAGQADAPSPGALMTKANARLFRKALEEAGNSQSTFCARVWEVRTALRIMAPEQNFSWLTSPGGVSIRTLCQDDVPRRPVEPMSSKELYDWGLALMAKADAEPSALIRAQIFRNGLLIAILASRAPRQRAIVSMRIDQQIVFEDETARIRFRREDLKWGRWLEYNLPSSLAAPVRRYIDVERPVLLDGQHHPWFWVGIRGGQLRAYGIQAIIRRQSERDFGRAFGTHSFRHALATSFALAMPDKAAGAAALLGNSPAVAEKYYNLGGQIEAAQQWTDALKQERAETAALARQLFKRAKS